MDTAKGTEDEETKESAKDEEKEDPLGVNDPEFKETLEQVLGNAAETEEAIKGLQGMMKVLSGVIGDPSNNPADDPKTDE